MDYSLFIQKLIDLFISNSQLIQIISNIAIVGTFMTTLVIFNKTFKQNKKTEQIKTVIEINKQLLESENQLEFVYKDIALKADTTPIALNNNTRLKKMNNNTIEPFIITYFNIWEWFALLVNNDFLSEEPLKRFFKDRFLTEYGSILNRFFGYLDFPEIKKLYKNWK
jgi:hypothetical protein